MAQVAAAAWIQSLAQEPPYAADVDLKKYLLLFLYYSLFRPVNVCFINSGIPMLGASICINIASSC